MYGVFLLFFFSLCEMASSYWLDRKPLVSAMTKVKIFSKKKHNSDL
jgi:hypothetical protein